MPASAVRRGRCATRRDARAARQFRWSPGSRGPITGGGRATHLRDDAGPLVTFDAAIYVIWGGKRSQIDPTNRRSPELGARPSATSPIQTSASSTGQDRAAAVPRCPRRAPGAGRQGIGVAGPNWRQPVLCATRRVKDSSFRRSAAQRELHVSGGAAGGDPDAGSTAGDLAAGWSTTRRAAEFR